MCIVRTLQIGERKFIDFVLSKTNGRKKRSSVAIYLFYMYLFGSSIVHLSKCSAAVTLFLLGWSGFNSRICYSYSTKGVVNNFCSKDHQTCETSSCEVTWTQSDGRKNSLPAVSFRGDSWHLSEALWDWNEKRHRCEPDRWCGAGRTHGINARRWTRGLSLSTFQSSQLASRVTWRVYIFPPLSTASPLYNIPPTDICVPHVVIFVLRVNTSKILTSLCCSRQQRTLSKEPLSHLHSCMLLFTFLTLCDSC